MGALGEHPGDPARAGGDLSRHEREAGAAVGGAGRSGVEAEPADPEERAADHCVEHVVRLELVHAEAAARADDERGGQGGHACGDVHYAAAGIVEVPGHEEESVRRPRPMCHRAVNDEVPEEDEHNDTGKLHSLCN